MHSSAILIDKEEYASEEMMQESVLKVIAYFDVFNYPVNEDEIFSFLGRCSSTLHIKTVLSELIDRKIIFQLGEFYSLQNNFLLTERRLKGNRDAVLQVQKALRLSKYLHWFPYVKGIAISGSLSKNFAYEGSDFDFFIITKANRLWIMRSMFFTFSRIASFLGFEKKFCLNYFIDECALEIEEKNIFTAVEIATLLPCCGETLFSKFFNANKWINEYIPNYQQKKIIITDFSNPLPRRFFEWCLNNKWGDKLDEKIRLHFYHRWQKLLQQKNIFSNGFQAGSLIAGKHTCKPFPEHFMQRILDKYRQKLEAAKAQL